MTRNTIRAAGRPLLVAFVLLAVFVALSGCAIFRSQPEAPLLQATAEQLAELLQQRDQAMQGMKALFRAQVKGPGIPLAQRVEGVFLYRRPDAVRLKGFNHLGGQLFDFRLHRDLYALRLAPTGQVYAGRTSELERMGKIGRPFRLTLWAVTGAAAVEPVQPGEQVRLYTEDERYRLVVLGADGHGGSPRPLRQLWFDRRNLQVVQEDLFGRDGEIDATTRFTDFRAVGPAASGVHEPSRPRGRAGMTPTDTGRSERDESVMLRPFKVITEDGRGGGSLQLIFHEIIPNPVLQPEDLGTPRSEWGDRDRR